MISILLLGTWCYDKLIHGTPHCPRKLESPCFVVLFLVPSAGFTQRATIDPNKDEIHVLSVSIYKKLESSQIPQQYIVLCFCK